MPKIIRRGRSPGDRRFVTTCDACDSQIEFKASESTHSGTNEDPTLETWTINCPVCESKLVGNHSNAVPDPVIYEYPTFDGKLKITQQ